MDILISGGTGFIGKKLGNLLVSEGHRLFIYTRQPEKYTCTKQVTYLGTDDISQQLPPIDVVINLAGESLFGYWTKQKKQKIIESRLRTTEKIVELIRQMNTKPKVFVTASAVGYYGTSQQMIFTENSQGTNTDFLSEVTRRWEQVAKEAELLGVRTVYARFGVVLDRKQGAFPLMTLPFRLFVGGKIASGKQWISWIHIDDCIHLLRYAIANENISGPLNLTTPQPIRNQEFSRIIAQTLKRPAIFPVPAILLRILLGEMSQLITEGQYVLPQKALEQNFLFKYRHFSEAARDLLT